MIGVNNGALFGAFLRLKDDGIMYKKERVSECVECVYILLYIRITLLLLIGINGLMLNFKAWFQNRTLNLFFMSA